MFTPPRRHAALLESTIGHVTTAAGEEARVQPDVNRYPVPDGRQAGDPLEELTVMLARHGQA